MEGEPVLIVLKPTPAVPVLQHRLRGPVPFTQCVTKGNVKAQWQETTYNLFTFSCLFLLPSTATTICYSHNVLSVSGPQTRGAKMRLQSPGLNSYPGTIAASLIYDGYLSSQIEILTILLVPDATHNFTKCFQFQPASSHPLNFSWSRVKEVISILLYSWDTIKS